MNKNTYEKIQDMDITQIISYCKKTDIQIDKLERVLLEHDPELPALLVQKIQFAKKRINKGFSFGYKILFIIFPFGYIFINNNYFKDLISGYKKDGSDKMVKQYYTFSFIGASIYIFAAIFSLF